MNEYEALRDQLLSGDLDSVTPQSANEAALKNAIASVGMEGLRKPQSRMEAYLAAFAERVKDLPYTGTSAPVELIAETQYSNAQEAVVPTSYPNEGDQITLYIDGVANVRTAKAVRVGDVTVVYIGNCETFGLGVTGTDDSFGLAFLPVYRAAFCLLADEETHTISCYAQQSIVHPIDEKYIEAPPIITQTDIENGISFEMGEKIEQRILDGKTPFVVRSVETDEAGNTDIVMCNVAQSSITYFTNGQKGIISNVMIAKNIETLTLIWGETNIKVALSTTIS